MFFPHHANIGIKRNEPLINSLDHLEEEFDKRVASMAERIVLKHSMSKNKSISVKTKNKIKKMEMFEEKKKALQKFLDIWNDWREFYLKLGPLKIKNEGQATVIENAIDFSKKNNLDLNIFIGTIHKAYVHKKFNPNFNVAASEYSLEFYDRLYEDVVADIDERNYMEEALI